MLAASRVQPNTLPPNISGATVMADCPNLRFSMVLSPLFRSIASRLKYDPA